MWIVAKGDSRYQGCKWRNVSVSVQIAVVIVCVQFKVYSAESTAGSVTESYKGCKKCPQLQWLRYGGHNELQ